MTQLASRLHMLCKFCVVIELRLLRLYHVKLSKVEYLYVMIMILIIQKLFVTKMAIVSRKFMKRK